MSEADPGFQEERVQKSESEETKHAPSEEEREIEKEADRLLRELENDFGFDDI